MSNDLFWSSSPDHAGWTIYNAQATGTGLAKLRDSNRGLNQNEWRLPRGLGPLNNMSPQDKLTVGSRSKSMRESRLDEPSRFEGDGSLLGSSSASVMRSSEDAADSRAKESKLGPMCALLHQKTQKHGAFAVSGHTL